MEAEALMLLYHYMSIVALKSDSMNDFLDVRETYLVHE